MSFDSEADRRDCLRDEIVKKSVDDVCRNISTGLATGTLEEWAFLQVAVVEALIRVIQLEIMSAMLRQELSQVEGELKCSPLNPSKEPNNQ